MSEDSVFAALAATGLPVKMLGAHCSALPRISYSMPEETVFFADDTRYAAFDVCEARLYTGRYPDLEAESLVDSALTAAGIAFSKRRTPIESERLHETTYTFTDKGKD